MVFLYFFEIGVDAANSSNIFYDRGITSIADQWGLILLVINQ